MSWMLSDYHCPGCGTFESLERRPAPETLQCECGEQAERTISAVRCRTVYGSVTRGVSETPPPGAMRTEALADGQPYSEWKKERHRGDRDAARRAVGIDRKVFSGA